MIISIPNHRSIVGEKQERVVVYNICLNGVLQGSCRFSQLFELNEAILDNSTRVQQARLPPFPKKHFLRKTSEAVADERRRELEQFLRFIAVDSEFSKLECVTEWVRQLQLGFVDIVGKESTFSVFLLDGTEIKVRALRDDKAIDIFKNVMKQLGIHSKYFQSFALYCAIESGIEPGDFKFGECKYKILRRVSDCELLVLLLSKFERKVRLVIHKTFFALQVSKLTDEKEVLRLLWLECCFGLQSGRDLDSFTRKELVESFNEGDQVSFIEACMRCNLLGTIHVYDCSCNNAKAASKNSSITLRQTAIHIRFEEAGVEREHIFKLRNVRCWKYLNIDHLQTHSLSFEYCVPSGAFEWVRIVSPQALYIGHWLYVLCKELKVSVEGYSSESQADSESLENELKSRTGVTLSASTSKSQAAKQQSNNLMSVESIQNVSTHSLASVLSTDVESNATFDNITDDDL
eukprot:Nk52_evm100s224 gene=Nk52_evmTU100s224